MPEDKLNKGVTPAEAKRQMEPDPEIRALQEKIKDYENLIRSIRLGEGQIQIATREIKMSLSSLDPYDNLYISSKGAGEKSSAVIHLTDIHYGEYQDSDEIEGFGKYSRKIAEYRILKVLLPKVVDWVEDHRKNNIVEEAVVLVTGDLISGDIHQELSVTNEVPCAVQTAEISSILAEFLRQLAAYFKTVRCEFITADNHSRLTVKPQYKEAGVNSYNYLVGYIIKEKVKDVLNVKFNMYTSLQAVVGVHKQSYLITHGHTIKGWAGLPYYGMDRKAGKEALRRMQRASAADVQTEEDIIRHLRAHRFDKVVMGHFHAPLNSPWWMVGGSISGTSTLDHGQGRYSPPCQTTWMVHRDAGEYDWTRWDLWEAR